MMFCVQFWAHLYKGHVGIVERIHQRSIKVMNGLEGLSMRKGLGLFGLEKRRLGENVINVNQCLKGGSKEDETLFSCAQ